MENKKGKIETIITLCHIIDDFAEFEEKLIPMISPKNNVNFAFKLGDISKGKFKLGARKEKKFYEENKSIIDTINNYSNITKFIIDNYNWRGKPNGTFHFFYQYISDHKDEIQQILDVLGKLNDLGFREFEFNKGLDFTKEIYKAYPSFQENLRFTYVANVEVMPTYDDNISYKTSNSNYKMELERIGDYIPKYGGEIILNSLSFNTKSFPESINRENTFEPILKLKEEQKEQSAVIRKSVDLGVSVFYLECQINSVNYAVNNLDDVENKEQLFEALLNISKDVEKFKALISQYNSNISEQEPLLTSEVLEREKILHLNRRTSNIYDD